MADSILAVLATLDVENRATENLTDLIRERSEKARTISRI